MWFKVKKKIIFHILSLFWNTSIFTKLIDLRSKVCSDWPAIQCVVIGRISQAQNAQKNLKMLRPLTVLWCRVLLRRHKKTIKPIINEDFAASSGDIFTDYNNFYCIFTHRICICDWSNDKQQALPYTAQNLRLNSQWQILQIRKRACRLWVRNARLFLRRWNCPTL